MLKVSSHGNSKSLGLLLVFITALFILACGSSAQPQEQPAPQGIDMESIRSAVQDAVNESNKAAPAPQEAPSSQEINSAVERAVTDAMSTGLPMVQSAVSEAMADSPSSDEITVMIEAAVSDAMAKGLKAEDVGPLVEQAIAEAVKPGITAEEVESLVSKAVERALAPGRLVIYSGRSKSLVDPIIQQFAETTGVDVAVKYANTPQLSATILEEGNNSPADVFFAQDPGGLGAVEGMLASLPDSILDQVPDWAHSPQGLWVGISGRARTVVYNTEKLTEDDLPSDMFGFTDPKWKGRIGWAPTNASFQTMVTAMRALWGDDRARLWLQGIQANEPRVYSKNTPQVAAAAAGEIDVGFVNHYYLFRFLAEEGENFAARNYHPTSGGPGSVIMVAGAGILSSAENSENAERFLSFMLSRVGQQYFAFQTYEYPLVEDVKTPRALIPLSDINSPQIALTGLADLAGTQKMLQETGVLP